jgi:hypothetical protein
MPPIAVGFLGACILVAAHVITPEMLVVICLGMMYGPSVIAISEAILDDLTTREPPLRLKRQSDGFGSAMMLFLFLFGAGFVLILVIAHLRGVPVN